MNWFFIPKILSRTQRHKPEKKGQQFNHRFHWLKELTPIRGLGAQLSIPAEFLVILTAPHLKKKRKGSAMMICVMLLGVFLTLGVGLLLNSQLFLQVQGCRKLNQISFYAAENGIKKALEKTLARAEELFSAREIDEETFIQFKTRLESGQNDLIEPLLVEAVLKESEELSGMNWETGALAQLAEFKNYEAYFRANFELNIKSNGQVQGFSGKRSTELLVGLTFFAGHLPLNQIPLAVEKEGLKESEQSQVKIISSDKSNLVSSRPFTFNSQSIPDQALPLISTGLKLFKPDRLPNWLLRQALGLEPDNRPVPDGVYLVKDDLGLGGVYVQGNLEELLMGIDNDFQIVQFRDKAGCWRLKFDPIKKKTFFLSPGKNEYFDLAPIPLIMVNGKIDSLAAGKINQDGYLLPSDNEQTPAFLAGLKLTIVCSGKINITSNLFSEGLEWKQGLPYLKDKNSQLIIWSTGKDFQSGELVDAGLNLIGEPETTRIITGSLIAGDQGLTASFASADLKIVGTLATTKINLAQNKLTIFARTESYSENPEEPDLQVYSLQPLLHLSQVKILEWRSAR